MSSGRTQDYGARDTGRTPEEAARARRPAALALRFIAVAAVVAMVVGVAWVAAQWGVLARALKPPQHGADDRARVSAHAAVPARAADSARDAMRVAGGAAESARARAAEPRFDFAGRVGVVQSARDSSLCLTIPNDHLARGDTLLLVLTDRPQAVAMARVEGPRSGPCTVPGDEWGSVTMERAAFYTVSLAPGGRLAEPAIALARAVAPLDVVHSLVAGDVDGDGRPERFTQCTSREGIHLRVVTPAPGGQIERWHQYFYVPYDLEPDCPGMREDEARR